MLNQTGDRQRLIDLLSDSLSALSWPICSTARAAPAQGGTGSPRSAGCLSWAQVALGGETVNEPLELTELAIEPQSPSWPRGSCGPKRSMSRSS